MCKINWNFFFEYATRPIGEILTSFNQKLSAELLIDELVRDVKMGMSKNLAHAVIKFNHLDDYVDSVMPEGQRTLMAAGLVTEDDSDMGYAFTRENATRLLYRLGYLQEED